MKGYEFPKVIQSSLTYKEIVNKDMTKLLFTSGEGVGGGVAIYTLCISSVTPSSSGGGNGTSAGFATSTVN